MVMMGLRDAQIQIADRNASDRMPTWADDDLGPIYAKQFAAQAIARQTSGNLSSQQLSAIGIGKAERTLSRREKVQQVHRLWADCGLSLAYADSVKQLSALCSMRADIHPRLFCHVPNDLGNSLLLVCILAKQFRVPTFIKLR